VTRRSDFDLQSIPGCFDGVIPPMLATCSAHGEPNATHLSQLHLVDDRHLALSNQFFGKTAANLAENPWACVLVTDSHTWDTYRMTLRYDHTEDGGPTFERMRASLETIGVGQGMEDVFRLRGADVYEVMAVDSSSMEDEP
jgi:hypothetical protein